MGAVAGAMAEAAIAEPNPSAHSPELLPTNSPMSSCILTLGIVLGSIAIAPLLAASSPGDNAPAVAPSPISVVSSAPVPAARKRFSIDRIGSRHARFDRELAEEIDQKSPPAPTCLAMRDLGEGLQMRFFGAPQTPPKNDTAGDRLQARFPVLSLVW